MAKLGAVFSAAFIYLHVGFLQQTNPKLITIL